jgi:hypothetical protein
MVDAWPSDLPQYLQASGAQQGLGDGLLEYQPDTGPAISRRRSTAVAEPLSGNVICTQAQLEAFKVFFKTTIMRGALPFAFPDPVSRDPVLVKFTKQSPPAWVSLGGDNFQLSLSLVILP